MVCGRKFWQTQWGLIYFSTYNDYMLIHDDLSSASLQEEEHSLFHLLKITWKKWEIFSNPNEDQKMFIMSEVPSDFQSMC